MPNLEEQLRASVLLNEHRAKAIAASAINGQLRQVEYTNNIAPVWGMPASADVRRKTHEFVDAHLSRIVRYTCLK